MPAIDPRVDAYIDNSAEFARPILAHIRAVVHDACPQVEEAIKWGMPHFMYNGILLSMAAFKAHCALTFWKGQLLLDGIDDKAQQAMGQFGRITSLRDLPPRTKLAGYVKQAMQLNAEGVKAPARARPATPRTVEVPGYLAEALAADKAARATFDAFTPGKRREYVEWLQEAKTDATRERRLAQALEWLAEGKTRNWKYEKC